MKKMIDRETLAKKLKFKPDRMIFFCETTGYQNNEWKKTQNIGKRIGLIVGSISFIFCVYLVAYDSVTWKIGFLGIIGSIIFCMIPGTLVGMMSALISLLIGSIISPEVCILQTSLAILDCISNSKAKGRAIPVDEMSEHSRS